MCQVIYEMDMGAPTMRMLRAFQPVFDEQGDLVYKQGRAGGMITCFSHVTWSSKAPTDSHKAPLVKFFRKVSRGLQWGPA